MQRTPNEPDEPVPASLYKYQTELFIIAPVMVRL
jgi:hypothetical protein